MGDGPFRRLFRIFAFRSDVARELDEELAFHFERTVEELVAEGMDRTEAEREARRRFGNERRYRRELQRIDRGRTTMTGIREWVEAARQTLSDTLRGLARSPGFAGAVVVTLALGIGANATMFQVVDRLLLRPPDHVEEPDRVRKVYGRRLAFNGQEWTTDFFTYPDLLDMREVDAFSGVAAYARVREQTLGGGAEASRIRAAPAGGSFFRVLGVEPVAGRFYTPEEDRVGAPGTAVLAEEFWTRRYGRDPDVLGRTLRIGDGRYTVVGVAPEGFTGVELQPVDVWLALEPFGAAEMGDDPPRWRNSRSWWWVQMAARLAPSATPETARSEATTVHRRARADVEGYDPEAEVFTASLVAAERPNAADEIAVSRWLAGVALVVLLIACANVANLFLARGHRRRRETAVRLALGVSRGRLVARDLAEAGSLALLGGGAALLVARWGREGIQRLLLPDVALSGPGLDPRLLLFTVAVVGIAALASGLLPALRASRPELVPALKEGGRRSSTSRSRLRAGFLVLQAGLSVVLLVGAGLFVLSLDRVGDIDPGFEIENVLMARIELDETPGPIPEERSGEAPAWPPDRRAGVYEEALRRLAGLPSVRSVAAAQPLPMSGSISTDFQVPGLDSVPTPPSGGPYVYSVTPDYFRTMGIDLLRGRVLEPADNAPSAERVAVVNRTLARTVWPAEEAVGRCVIVGADTVPCTRIVGVVEDTRRQDLVGEGEQMLYYVPIRQQQLRGSPAGLLVRVSGDPDAAAATVRRRLRDLGPAVRFANVQPFRSLVSHELRPWRLGATMFTVFGLLALVVAAVGLYSVLAFDVAQRRYELGIRSALGATKERLVGLVVREAVTLVGVGIALGILAALAAGRWIEPLLYQVSPADPLVLAGVAGALGLVAVVASSIPALRATRVDPNRALRAE